MRSGGASSLGALRAGWRQQSLSGRRDASRWFMIAVGLPQAVVIGWLAGRSSSDAIYTRVVFGQALLTAWTATVIWLAWIVFDETYRGTFELGVAAPSPVAATVFGKGIALVVNGLVGGLGSVVVVLAVAHRAPRIDHPVLTAVLLFVTAVGVVPATAFLIAPVGALSSACRSLVNMVIPIGILLSGFVVPLRALPAWLRPLGRVLPTSWAMDAVVDSATSHAVGDALVHLAAAIVLAVGWAVLAVWTMGQVEQRFISRGSLL